MKAAVPRAYGTLKVEEIPEVTPGPYDALVDIIACGFCNGTDMKLVDGQFPPHGTPPSVMGHEAVGRVTRIGSRVRHYRVGDCVYRPMARFDGPDDTAELNFSWGGFAERGKVTDGRAFAEDHPGVPLDFWSTQQRTCPADIPAEDAIMMITVMETWSWLDRFGIDRGTSVIVFGLGPVGLAMAECCRAMQAPLIMGVARSDATLDRARRFGVTHVLRNDEELHGRVMQLTGGAGADRIVDAVGSRAIVAQSEGLVAEGGRIGVYGIEPRAPGADPVPYCVMGSHAYSLHFVSPDEPAAQNTVLEFYKQGRIAPHAYISHHLPLSDIGGAIELIRHQAATKIVIDINPSAE